MGVIILGTHRGGTSAVTALVHSLGLDAGPEHARIGPTKDNPNGYWELEPLRALNERLLIELDARWSAPPSIEPAELEALADGPWGEEASTVFAGLLPGGQWVWKDPRLCLLLPFWRRVLNDDLHVVATIRHPEDVAHSLQNRDGFSVPYGLALWERHQRRAIIDSAGLPTHVLHYDDLIDDPATRAVEVASFLSAQGYAVEDGSAGLADLIDPSIRHHHERRTLAACPEASAEQAALYELLASATGSDSATWDIDLGPETPSLQLAFDEHARMGRWADLSAQLRAGLEELRAVNDARRADLVAEIAELEVLLETSRTTAAENWVEVRRLEADHIDATEGREAVIEALEAMITERDGWKWGVLQQEAKPLARARRGLRRALVGDDD